MFNNTIRKSAFGLISVAMVCSASAGITTANFDFENQALTAPGGVNTLTVSNNGLSITIDRVGQPFDVVDLTSQSVSASFGKRSISPTPPGANFFNVNFSQPVNSFSVEMGDFTASGLANNLALTAFTGANGTGTNLGTSSGTLTLNSSTAFASKVISFSGAGIGSVEFIGGDSINANSVYYDNFSASFTAASTGGNGGGGSSAVPLPPALLVAPLGAFVAWLGARRLRLTASGR